MGTFLARRLEEILRVNFQVKKDYVQYCVFKVTLNIVVLAVGTQSIKSYGCLVYLLTKVKRSWKEFSKYPRMDHNIPHNITKITNILIHSLHNMENINYYSRKVLELFMSFKKCF